MPSRCGTCEARGEVLSLPGHTDSVYGIGWSPDGSRLATASFDRCIKLWDAGTGHEVLTLHGHEDRVWSVAGARTAGGWSRRATTAPSGSGGRPSSMAQVRRPIATRWCARGTTGKRSRRRTTRAPSSSPAATRARSDRSHNGRRAGRGLGGQGPARPGHCRAAPRSPPRSPARPRRTRQLGDALVSVGRGRGGRRVQGSRPSRARVRLEPLHSGQGPARARSTR